MASTIVTKNSSTASAVPVAGDLTKGELAVNVTDKRLFTKDNGGLVVELGTNPSALSLPNGTANGVAYLNGSKVVTTGSALTFDGTTLKSTQGSSGATAPTNANSLVLENGAAVGMTLLSPDANAARIYFGTASNNRNAFIYSDYNSGSQTLIFGVGSSTTSAAERMRLTSTGLAVGTTSLLGRVNSYLADGGNPGSSQIGIWSKANYVAGYDGYVNNTAQVAFGYYGGTYAPAAIGWICTTASGNTYGDLIFATRNVTTDTQPTERARIDSSGNLIQSAPSTAPTLSTNGTMVFNLTSNTNLRVSVRGSDGVTRTANFTLA